MGYLLQLEMLWMQDVIDNGWVMDGRKIKILCLLVHSLVRI